MKKIVKLALSLAVASTAFVAALAVNANAESVSLVYDEVNSTSQTAYVSLVTDVASVPSYEVTIGAENAQIASFEVVEALAGMNHNITTADQAAVAVTDGQLLTTAYVSGEAATVPASGVIWTLKITFTEPLSADDTLAWLDYSYVEGGDGEWIDSDTITASCKVLANPNAGGEEEEPVVINAEDAGMFTYWQDAPVAQAFFANLTAEQAAKDSIVWTVTDGTPDKTKTEVANIDTEVSGESGVVLGLVVSNAVEGLTATVTVK